MKANKELAEVNNTLPAYLQGAQQTARLGNLDSNDIVMPRVVLLQALSPQVQEFDSAKAGIFWHSLADQSLGKEIKVIPIIVRKRYLLWAPRGDDRGILARADDGVNWVPSNAEFKVKPKGAASEVTWRTLKTVAESGLGEFGTSIPGNSDSQPAASLTYEILVWLTDHPEASPAIITMTRSSIKAAKGWFSKIQGRNVDQFAQLYMLRSIEDKGAEGPFFNWSVQSAGFATAEDYERCKALYGKLSGGNFRADAEEAAAPVAESKSF